MNTKSWDMSTKPEQSLACNGFIVYGQCYPATFHRYKGVDYVFFEQGQSFAPLLQNPHAYLVEDNRRPTEGQKLLVRVVFIGACGAAVAERVPQN